MDLGMKRIAGSLYRLAERLLPTPLLALFTLPAALLLGRRMILRNSSVRMVDGLPPALRPKGRRWRWRARLRRLAVFMTQFLIYIPDRLRRPRWRRRCRLIGVKHLEEPLSRGQPVVLATVHYANLPMIYHWLRSFGYPVAFISARKKHQPAFRDRLDTLADRANGMGGVAREIHEDELWDARDFLVEAPGRVLGLVMDAAHKRLVAANGPGYSLTLSEGGLRLAMVAEAAVVPCLISSHRCLSSVIRFGRPVPPEDIADPRRHRKACEHIARQLVPWIVQQPEQCTRGLIEHFGPPAPHGDGASEPAPLPGE